MQRVFGPAESGGFTGTSRGFSVDRAGWVSVQCLVAGTSFELEYTLDGVNWLPYSDDVVGSQLILATGNAGVSWYLPRALYRFDVTAAAEDDYVDVGGDITLSSAVIEEEA